MLVVRGVVMACFASDVCNAAVAVVRELRSGYLHVTQSLPPALTLGNERM
jgi:hypothetical protein